MLSSSHGDIRTLAVTSTQPKEGKTVVSASLAASMAMTGRRVLLIDSDLRRAQVHKIFGTPTSPGMSNVLAGAAKPSAALIESSVPGLFLMPAGDHPGGSELLDTEAVRQLLDGLHKVFDLIVLDCPPVMALADASIVANVATSVLFVVGSGSTNTEAARTAIDRLSSVQAQVVGVVLNNAKVSRNSSYGYSYYAEGAA
jgi:capsular exopolysaccharide synthesis family protein